MGYNKLKILYIAGSGRSGSTIISNILGQIDGFYFAGELCKIWRYGLIENRVCGCGAPLKECEFWIDVFNSAYGGINKISGEYVYGLRKKSAYMRHIPMMLLPGGQQLLTNEVKEFSGTLEKLYRNIKKKTGCRVIVDCSKTAPYGRILERIKGVDLHILHLVRDPRGVAFSKLEKRLYQPDNGQKVFTGQAGILKSSLYWVIQNFATEAFWKNNKERYLRISYEDFAMNPKRIIEKILQQLVKEKADLTFINNHRVMFEKKIHTAAGNPVRFNSGEVDVIHDTEWQYKLPQEKQRLIQLLTLPYYVKYNYHKNT